jgi:hypothetical protein
MRTYERRESILVVVGQTSNAAGEQFIDPSTGDPVEVMFDPRTGERRYVAGKSREAEHR